LRTKHRVLIAIVIVLIFYCALPIPYSPINRIGILFNINEQDPLFYEKSNTATFEYHDGYAVNTFTVKVETVSDTWANITYNITTASSYNATIEGRVSGTDRYSIMWIHIPNIFIEGLGVGTSPGTIYNVTDPFGLLGIKNGNYTAIVDREIVYWALDPGLHGAQFSFRVSFYNESNNAIVGQALYDSTCGMLFTLNGGSPYSQVKLLETTYPISRNRMTIIYWAIGLFAGVTAIAYILMKKKWNLDDETTNEITLLLGAGGAAFVVDVFVDVWFYALFDLLGSILLHLGVAVGFLAICLYKKYGFKCITPALAEIAFIVSIVIFVGDDFVPHLTAAWGLIISWLIMLYLSGRPRQPKSKRKLGRFIDQFV
jgi:hypothetical protein